MLILAPLFQLEHAGRSNTAVMQRCILGGPAEPYWLWLEYCYFLPCSLVVCDGLSISTDTLHLQLLL